MKRISNIIKNKRGEGYIDVVISVFVSMLLLVLTINVFSFLSIKQDMDYIAKEMVKCATANGCTKGETNNRYTELCNDVGFSPTYTWKSSYFNSVNQTVQLGDTIKVTVTYKTNFKGFGIFSIPITLTSKSSGISQKYWK